MKHYVMNADKTVHEMPDLIEWGRRFEQDERSVAQTKLTGTLVSTVFLGLDHNFRDTGTPLLFETMVIGGPLDERIWRCSTYLEAEAQHAKVVTLVEEAQSSSSRSPDDGASTCGGLTAGDRTGKGE